MSSWGTTLRIMVLVVAVLAALLTGLWMLGADLRIGPVQITRHDPPGSENAH